MLDVLFSIFLGSLYLLGIIAAAIVLVLAGTFLSGMIYATVRRIRDRRSSR